MASWQFEALGSHVRVSCESAALSRRLAAHLSSYQPSDADPDMDYCFECAEQCRLSLDGEEVYVSEDRDEVADFFLLDLYRKLVARVSERWLLHAASLVRNGKALVLAGPSNSGKSTLTRALMKRGWHYISEEITSLTHTSIDGLRRPLRLDSESQLTSLPDGLQIHELGIGSQRSWLALPPDESVSVRSTIALIRLRYRPDAETRLTPLVGSAALQALWPCRMNSGLSVAEVAFKTVAAVPCYRLDAADVESAVAAIDSIES